MLTIVKMEAQLYTRRHAVEAQEYLNDLLKWQSAQREKDERCNARKAVNGTESGLFAPIDRYKIFRSFKGLLLHGLFALSAHLPCIAYLLWKYYQETSSPRELIYLAFKVGRIHQDLLCTSRSDRCSTPSQFISEPQGDQEVSADLSGTLMTTILIDLVNLENLNAIYELALRHSMKIM